ncbi:O-antigen translocase [Pseudomonas fluorescens]|jgi:O-antigen/teichoic acid export membrane protein|uniref:O-antigen flippase n=2 Tax=Pseudomonas fluorescens group TaxID=136843 RepID=A0A2N1DWB8_PSEFL|nr:O-antigen translocase [Pseudomonas fluorescens]MBD8100296.1 O-antigen translocase [Pseudomonas fluorescens]MBD8776212.1 O-antigen translocase [Pseudomonas fluorescens]MBD8781906.1 O-antigen translocase [Pseudomonas fluorescens]MBD8797896.1 O-antigen translocase [Pseudomonas fluorescens]PKH14145.1 O-antigen flippase [Pseudomonas fluorescens]
MPPVGKLKEKRAGLLAGAFFTSAAQASKILVGFCILKLIALYLGADGLGKLGHFMSLVSIAVLLAGGGLGHGVIKYVAEFKDSKFSLYRLFSTSVFYALGASILVLVALFSFAEKISVLVFGEPRFYWVILCLAVAQVAFAFNILFSGFFNGLGKLKVNAVVQVVSNILALPLIWFLISSYKMPGAAIAMLAIFVMPIIVSLFFVKGMPLFRMIKWRKFDVGIGKGFARFGLMLLVSAVMFPVVEIVIRESLITQVGYSEAGIWQGSIKLSSAYIGFFSVFLASYYMPLISATREKKAITRQVIKFMLLVMGGFLIGGSVLYFGRHFFIPLLLSSEFNELENYIIFQLVGDFFKVSAYVIGFVAVAKAATKLYILSEVIQALLFVGLTFSLGKSIGGIYGVMYSYMIAYIVFFVMCVIGFACWARR